MQKTPEQRIFIVEQYILTGSVRRILKKDLGLKSHKLQILQQLSLSAGDRERRLIGVLQQNEENG